MPPPVLYAILASPPVRSTLIFARAINLQLDIKPLDLTLGEHLTPEFLKLNPQHTVPTLVDNDGFAIWDSHAIIPYLYSKYGKNDELYPNDPKQRAIINQRLHFDSGVAFATLRNALFPIIQKQKEKFTDQDKQNIDQVYVFLEAFLKESNWVAGNDKSIADYSLIGTISSINAIVPINAGKYPKIACWMKRVEALPEYDANKQGLILFQAIIKDFF